MDNIKIINELIKLQRSMFYDLESNSKTVSRSPRTTLPFFKNYVLVQSKKRNPEDVTIQSYFQQNLKDCYEGVSQLITDIQAGKIAGDDVYARINNIRVKIIDPALNARHVTHKKLDGTEIEIGIPPSKMKQYLSRVSLLKTLNSLSYVSGYSEFAGDPNRNTTQAPVEMKTHAHRNK